MTAMLPKNIDIILNPQDYFLNTFDIYRKMSYDSYQERDNSINDLDDILSVIILNQDGD